MGERDLGTTIANSLMSELRIPRNLKATIAAVTFALLAISAVADKPRTKRTRANDVRLSDNWSSMVASFRVGG